MSSDKNVLNTYIVPLVFVSGALSKDNKSYLKCVEVEAISDFEALGKAIDQCQKKCSDIADLNLGMYEVIKID